MAVFLLFRNKKLKETLAKVEAMIKDLSKDGKMTMLILGQTKGSGNLEEEFKHVCLLIISNYFYQMKCVQKILVLNCQ